MRSDIEIREILSNKSYNLHCKTLFSKLTIEEQHYILSKYNDSESLNESIYRFINNLDIRPTCKYCNGKIKSFRFDRGFAEFCSKSCLASYKNLKNNSILSLQNGLIKKYNVNNAAFIPEIQEKKKQTCIKKYNVEYSLQSKEVREKITNTLFNKYGTKYAPTALVKMCEGSYKKYGTNYPTQSKIYWDNYNFIEAKIKENNTKKKNNSYNISKKEEICYNILKEKFPDIIRQYSDNKYIFNCDFYIPSINTYIEYNGSHYHHYHPFNENNKEDIKELLKLKKLEQEKLKYQNKTQYTFIIYTWTDLDVRKRKIAKENNLNFIEFWNIDEVKEWIKNK